MPKYYIHSGTLSIIYSTPKHAMAAACDVMREATNENDVIGMMIYVDERGIRNEQTKDSKTIVFQTDEIMEMMDEDFPS